MERCVACGAELPGGAGFCPTCGTPTSPGLPTRERKVATVLFADLVGSTELGEQDPERTRAMLDRFYDSMAGEIGAAGGTVEKFVGDAVMAAFGAPVAQEDHAERALHAALWMRARLEEVFGEALALRIGVNTGEVAVGRPREGSSFVTGDPVNVCARLEQAARPGEVLVGESTVAAVGAAFEFDNPATIEAKGKPEGVRCRRLRRAIGRSRPRGLAPLGRTFVGRDLELDEVLESYRAAVEDGTTHLVTVFGDAGVGKSTLVGELSGRLGSARPEPVLRKGRCLAYGRATTYWAFGEILREHLGLMESDPSESAVERLGDRPILALSLGLDVAGDLHPLVARERHERAWVELFEEMAASAPLVVLLEDLHWAEEPMLDLVERLRREARGRVLMLATARPELLDHRPGWGEAAPRVAMIRLEPLSALDVESMLIEVLGSPPPAALLDIVIRNAEGNPFYVEELLATLLDRGALVRREGEWTVTELPAILQAPGSVQSLVAARIDRLPATEKAGLQAGSVIGRIFWARPVHELVDGRDPDYQVLEKREFVRPSSVSSMEDDREFGFKHAVTRDVAYGSLARASRLRLHARFAQWLEGFAADRDDLAPLLAHHFAQSVLAGSVDLAWGDDEERVRRLRASAVRWLSRAAELAVGRYDIDGAVALFRQALELEASPGRQAELWKEIGRAHALRYEGDAFWAAFQRAIELSDDDAVTADLHAEVSLQTAMRFGMWRRMPDVSLVDGWIDRALSMAGPRSASRAKALVARVYWHETDLGAKDAAAEASEIAESLGDIELRSLALSARSIAALAEGDLEHADAFARDRLALLPEISDADHRAEATKNAMYPAMSLGRVQEARRIGHLLYEVTAELSSHHRVHGISHVLLAEEYSGRWQAIQELSTRAEEVVEANEETPCLLNVGTLLRCALASAVLGDVDEAARFERKADALGMEGYELGLNPTRVRLALVRGDLATVERLLPTIPREAYGNGDAWVLAIRLDALAALGAREAIEAEAPPSLVPGTYLEPFALRALGQVRGDPELIEQAAERFEAMGLEWHAARTREAASSA